MFHCYVDKSFRAPSLEIIDGANAILDDMDNQGFVLTVRQLYYQFVSLDMFPEDRKWILVNKKWVKHDEGTKNAPPNYKWLASICNDARMAGLMDWDSFEDRTRALHQWSTWDSPADLLEAAANQYRIDKWASQEYRFEIWIEKDALTGLINPICKELQIPYFACKGYNSQSAQYEASQRFRNYALSETKKVVVFHLGDHDPSGIDMTRDNHDRLKLLMTNDSSFALEFKRIALTMDQIDELQPPPDPAKLTDSRASEYVKKYGDGSWELDALKPKYIHELIKDFVLDRRDDYLWESAVEDEEEDKAKMADMITKMQDEG